VDDYLAKVWEPHVGKLDQAITRFLRDGLLEDATVADKLASRGRPELQALARHYGVRISGTKRELADALAVVLPPRVADELVGSVRMYRATPSGQAIIDASQANERRAYAAMELDALAALRRGDIKRAHAAVMRYMLDHHYVVRPAKDSPPPDEAAYLLASRYEDLPADDRIRREVAVQLALCVLEGDYNKVERRLLDATDGEFSCPAVVAYLGNDPHGVEHREIRPEDVASLYGHTKIAEAQSARTLAELRKAQKPVPRGMERFAVRGIQILSNPKNPCHVCDSGKLTYRWSEIGELPRLPRHWGCTCCYTAWV
jgi:hypothetical protein